MIISQGNKQIVKSLKVADYRISSVFFNFERKYFTHAPFYYIEVNERVAKLINSQLSVP